MNWYETIEAAKILHQNTVTFPCSKFLGNSFWEYFYLLPKWDKNCNIKALNTANSLLWTPKIPVKNKKVLPCSKEVFMEQSRPHLNLKTKYSNQKWVFWLPAFQHGKWWLSLADNLGKDWTLLWNTVAPPQPLHMKSLEIFSGSLCSGNFYHL